MKERQYQILSLAYFMRVQPVRGGDQLGTQPVYTGDPVTSFYSFNNGRTEPFCGSDSSSDTTQEETPDNF